MTDHALDALLAEYAPPPVPAGLAARAAAAAVALPQEPRRAYPRRATRDRRGPWLRRPTLIGAIALGLTVSGAVAATLAGLRLDRLPVVQAVLRPLLAPNSAAGPAAPRASPPPLAVEPAAVQEAPVAALEPAEASAPPRAPPRDAPPPAAAEDSDPPPSEIVVPRPIELPPALPPLAPARQDVIAAPAPDARPGAPSVDEVARLRPERIERAERLRAARQAQIERLQRIQQRRERFRRLRRD